MLKTDIPNTLLLDLKFEKDQISTFLKKLLHFSN